MSIEQEQLQVLIERTAVLPNCNVQERITTGNGARSCDLCGIMRCPHYNEAEDEIISDFDVVWPKSVKVPAATLNAARALLTTVCEARIAGRDAAIGVLMQEAGAAFSREEDAEAKLLRGVVKTIREACYRDDLKLHTLRKQGDILENTKETR